MVMWLTGAPPEVSALSSLVGLVSAFAYLAAIDAAEWDLV